MTLKKKRTIRYMTKDIKRSEESGLILPRFVSVNVEGKSVKRYHNTAAILSRLSRCARVLLDFLVEEMDENNLVINDNKLKSKLNRLVKRIGQKPYGSGTINKAFIELTDSFLLEGTKKKGTYRVNPLFFFAGEDTDRIKMIRRKLESPYRGIINFQRRQYYEKLENEPEVID